jgi:D-sedoheptulose 7-phosphate isomerase
MDFAHYLHESRDVLDATSTAISQAAINAAIDAVTGALGQGKPVLVCGNGGSAADAMHLTGELVGRFLCERPALKVICLADNAAVLTAWSNDYSYETVFSRQVEAYGEKGAVLIGISTSGNSGNVLAAFSKAHSMGMTTIALTGQGGGRLFAEADHLLAVPSRCTPLIQQAHLCIYHYMCQIIEQRMCPPPAIPE